MQLKKSNDFALTDCFQTHSYIQTDLLSVFFNREKTKP